MESRGGQSSAHARAHTDTNREDRMNRHCWLGVATWILALGAAPAQVPSGADPAPRGPSTPVRTISTSVASDAVGEADGQPAVWPNPTCGDCPEGVCGPPGRFWVRTEALLWWTRGQEFPPLVTASPLGTPLSTAGLLGQPTTAVLFGGDRMDADTRTGARITAGFWLDREQTLGLEASYFQLETEIDNFTANQASNPVLTLPFFDVNGQQRRRVTNFPGFASGAVSLDSSSRFYSGDAHLLANLYCGCNCRVDALLGYRQARLNDNFLFADSERDTAGRQIDLVDQFDTRNRFHGADLGLAAQLRRCNWSVDLSARVALGVNERDVNVNGASLFTVPGQAPVTRPGGFLALPSNIGRRSDDEFTAIPELSAAVGYQVTRRLRATLGYTFIYWPNVVRSGDQIDTTVNQSQLPSVTSPGALMGPARPAPLLNDSDFWAHGLSFGLELRF